MTAAPSEIVLPAGAVLRSAGGPPLLRVERRRTPPVGAHIAVENLLSSAGWDYYEVTSLERWFAATATHQDIPNMLPGDVVVELRQLPAPDQPWELPQVGPSGFVQLLDGRLVGHVMPDTYQLDEVQTLDHPAGRARCRVTGIRYWFRYYSMLPAGTPMYSHLATALLLTRISL